MVDSAPIVSDAKVLLQSSDSLAQILHETFPPSHFDGTNFVFAFGYGSGVLSQQHSSSVRNQKDNVDPTKMVDVILVVHNAQLFHENNIRYNPNHYNRTLLAFPYLMGKSNEHALRSRQAAICTRLQCARLPINPWLTNPGVFFHLVEDEPKLKYGIVEMDDLMKDLQEWSFLYLAGRMHKPIVPIPLFEFGRPCNNNNGAMTRALQVQAAQEQQNLPAAFATALLYLWYENAMNKTLSEANEIAFHDTDVYQRIVGLSYSGDPRVGAFEDPKKIQNIVQSQYSKFISLYHPIVQSMVEEGLLSITSTGAADNSSTNMAPSSQNEFSYDWNHPKAHDRLWQCIPPALRQRCGYNMSNTGSFSSSLSTALPAIRTLQHLLATQIVAPAARCQSVKGLFTTGWTKSLFYAYRKFTKGRLYKG